MTDQLAISAYESPEVLLAGLNRDLLRMGSAAAYLSNVDPDLRARIMNVLRRTLIAEVLHQRYVVAVAGIQGAGKTTFVQKVMGVDDYLLKPNLGRGEKLPVLIVGDASVSEPTPVARELVVPQTDGPPIALTETRSLSIDEWMDALTGERESTLLPELHVPKDRGLGDGRGLLLLPGYEKRSRANAVWQDYMRQALVASSVCVVVVDQTRMADALQEEIISDLRRYVADAKPIVVYAKAEASTVSDERRKDLTESACEVFDIHPDEASTRVLFSGEDSDPTSLKEALFSAIQRYGDISAGSRAAQLEALREVLTVGIGSLDDSIDNARAKVTVKAGSIELQYEAALEVFDVAAERLADAFDKELKAAVAKHKSKAIELAKDLHEDEAGFLDKAKQFFESAGERERRVTGYVKDAWKDAGPGDDGLTPAVVNVMGVVVAKRLAIEAPPKFHPGKPKDRLPALRYPEFSDGSHLSEGVQNDLELIATMNADSIQKPSKEWRDSISLLPALALEFVRTAQVAPELVRVSPDTLKFDHADPSEIVSSLASAFEGWSVAQRRLLMTAGAVLGLDVLVDGQINSIPMLANAVSAAVAGIVPGGAGAAVGAAAGAAVGAAIGFVAVGALGAVAINELRRIDMRQRDALAIAVSSVGDQLLVHYRDGFDDVMKTTREVFDARLRQWLMLDVNFQHDQWLAKALQDVRVRSTDLLEAIDADPIIVARSLQSSP